MNRIKRAASLPDLSVASDLLASRINPPSHQPAPSGDAPPAVEFAYAQYRPLHYEPNYAYPLVVFLHGPRGSERQLSQFMPELSERNYVGISPRGVQKHDLSGYCWGEEPSEGSIVEAFDRVSQCIELASGEFNIAPHRVFLAGYEDGGSMALRLAMRCPQYFAGAVSLCGAFPVGHAPLANLKHVRDLPLLLTNGRDARRYTVDQSCEELRLFHAAGMAVSLRQYPCGDELDSNMLRDMNAWIMELVTGTPADYDAATPCEPWSDEAN